jgi:hypothetical protein
MLFVIVQKRIAIFVPLRNASNSCPLELLVARIERGTGGGFAIQTVGAAITIQLCVPSSTSVQNVGIPVWRDRQHNNTKCSYVRAWFLLKLTYFTE